MSLTPDLFGLSISRTECRPACHLDLRSYPVPRPASLPTRNAMGLKVLLSPARLGQFSITLTQLLCHAPRRRGIQYAPRVPWKSCPREGGELLVRWLLDHPLSRMMTSREPAARSNKESAQVRKKALAFV